MASFPYRLSSYRWVAATSATAYRLSVAAALLSTLLSALMVSAPWSPLPPGEHDRATAVVGNADASVNVFGAPPISGLGKSAGFKLMVEGIGDGGADDSAAEDGDAGGVAGH